LDEWRTIQEMPKSDIDPKELGDTAAGLAVQLFAWKTATETKAVSEGKDPPAGISSDDFEQASEVAEKELGKPEVKSKLCAALESAGKDLVEVTKIVAAVICPLSIAGAVTIPLTPLAIAAAALVVFRMGVSAYCTAGGSEK
jgi:hypothetical protein